MKRGFTLHEMLVSLAMMSIVIAAVARVALDQARLYRGVADAASVRSEVAMTGDIVANLAWGVAPAAGDLLVADDSAFAARIAIGSAVVCASLPGRITIPAPTQAPGAVLAAFAIPPSAGDAVEALFADSLGTTWLKFHVAGAPTSNSGCAAFPGVAGTWDVALAEPLVIAAGSLVHFTRPMRLSLYRSTDNRWYLGGKDWNGASATFNGIQPVSGPLRAYDEDPGRTGLRFVYRDGAGAELPQPVDRARVRVITVLTRGASTTSTQAPGSVNVPTLGDSVLTVIRLRNP